MYNKNFVAVIKCDNNILRERESNIIYLPFGSEYSILLKNKDSRKALVEIEVDGKDVLKNNKLILCGNETAEIKGFMQDMHTTNKFKFIHKTKDIQEHRGDRIDDGLVKITFQFEKDIPPYLLTWYSFPYSYYGYDATYYPTTGGFSNNSNSVAFSSSNTKHFTPKQDEGITVKGSKINQTYNHSSIGFMEDNKNVITLQLRGITSDNNIIKVPMTVKNKLICETCGKKNKSINKFCYNCGTYLDRG